MWLPDRQTDRRTDGRTDRRMDRQTPDKVIPMCRYASQVTQKALYRIEIYRHCIKIHQNDKVQKDVKNAPKIWLWNGIKNINPSSNIHLDHCHIIRFVAVAFQSEEAVLWRMDPSMTYFCPTLDPSLGGVCRKVLPQVRGHEFFTPTKFRKHPSSGSEAKADYVFQYIYMH